MDKPILSPKSKFYFRIFAKNNRIFVKQTNNFYHEKNSQNLANAADDCRYGTHDLLPKRQNGSLYPEKENPTNLPFLGLPRQNSFSALGME